MQVLFALIQQLIKLSSHKLEVIALVFAIMAVLGQLVLLFVALRLPVG